MTTTLSAAVIQAIHDGHLADPFAVFGVHQDNNTVVVRTFQPSATSIELIDESEHVHTMNAVDSHGLFEVQLTNHPGKYQFKCNNQHSTWFLKDAYAYPSAIGALDHHLFGEGTHQLLYQILGSHLTTVNHVSGVRFGVWAPNAKRVSVIGEFNRWDGRVHVMRKHLENGIWDIFIPDIGNITLYKYEIVSENNTVVTIKNDPYAPYFEQAPGNASIVFNSEFIWSDDQYMIDRATINPTEAPISIYEVHAGSWRLNDNGNPLTYRELSETLIPYVAENKFTHIELMPITEHPFTGSWGYQPVGLFAPTSRFGSPDDFRYFVDQCHRANIGVIIDWVPAHFPSDEHGLSFFDGTHLYEHSDPRQGVHQDWDTLIYNYGRREVANYLFSNAVYWIKEFHIDGLRVDAVASMLYLDYSREEGQWVPNEHGGRENLEAIAFLKRMNELVHAEGGMTLAEESTSFPAVSHPTEFNGLGFTFKWNMGWMHDTLEYLSKEPTYRKYHHNNLTFGLTYAFSENFLLPFSHDEVVYGKGSLLTKMPGDEWQRFANLRICFAYQYLYPGKKLMFMGSEIAQATEWSHDGQVDWGLLNQDANAKLLALVRDLNHLYQSQPSLYEGDCHGDGFEWIDCADVEQSVVSFYRRAIGRSTGNVGDYTIVVCNFTPVPRHNYCLGVDENREYVEILNTDAGCYGGSDLGNMTHVVSEAGEQHGRACTLKLTLPPLSIIVLRPYP